MSNNNPLNNNLRIIHWNANGITNKSDELKILLNNEKIDIALINETRLLPSSKLTIPNYFTYRTDNSPRPGSTANGGTAILIHRRIVHRHIVLNTSLNFTTIEISLGQSPVRVSAVYKRPQNLLDPYDLDTLTGGCEWFIVAGDLNSKHPFWNSHSTNRDGNVLYAHLQQSDYTIIAPNTPTHFPRHPGHRPDVLDVALVRLPQHHTDVTNINELSCDHNPILASQTRLFPHPHQYLHIK